MLSLVPEAPDALSDEDVSLDVELLSSVELVALVELADEASLEALALESLDSVVISGGGGGGGGALAASVASPEAPDVVVSLVEVVDDAESEDGGGGGGGGAMAASAVSSEVPDVVVSSVEVADDEASEDGGGGGGVMAVSVPPICSCSDRSTDCMSLLSDEKALPDDTVLDVELLLWLLEEDGAKAVAADVPLLLDAPRRAARLLVLLVRAERDDICCLREKLPLQL